MKNDIEQRYWITYLKWWKANQSKVSGEVALPTKDAFWAWYALNHLDTDSQ